MAYLRSLLVHVLLQLLTAHLVICQNGFQAALYSSSPPVYPSPKSTGRGWQAAFLKAQQFVARLNLTQKANMVTGGAGPCVGNIEPIYSLGFNGLCLQDGPLAIRQASNASVFPAGVTIAASWDRNLMRQRGIYMGQEFKGKGAHVALGPVAGPLGRTAFGGRNWEGFSADPWLTGIAMQETITGIQSQNVQACAKHWVGNEQETQRNPSAPNLISNAFGGIFSGPPQQEAISSNIDDRTLHELYAWPFYNAVRAGVASVMCSYQKANQSYACQNSKLLNGVLKQEMGFQGYVMSDWLATHAGVDAVNSGLDMNMPGIDLEKFPASAVGFWGSKLVTAVQNGTLAETRLNDMITRILTPYYYFQQDSPTYPSIDPSSYNYIVLAVGNAAAESAGYHDQFVLSGPGNRDVRANHAPFIRQAAAAGIVLLKNTGAALPLKKPKNIFVFGNDQSDPPGDFLTLNGITNTPLGTLPFGGGSGSGTLTRLVSPIDALNERAAADGSKINNYDIQLAADVVLALNGAASADVCLVFVKAYSEESTDRKTLDVDWNGNQIVSKVADGCKNTVVVVHAPGQVNLPWADHPNIKAILIAHYPGEESGHSIVDVLYGDVNPSGHLPYTIARNESYYGTTVTKAPVSSGKTGWQSNFTEGLLIDYRYFDSITPTTSKISDQVAFPFGFGLSYTTFSVSGFASTAPSTSVPSSADPLDKLFAPFTTVTTTVKNTGTVSGAAVPQLYLNIPAAAGPPGSPNSNVKNNPRRVLRGFQKVSLTAGQSQQVSFALARRDVSYWDAWSQTWKLAEGPITAEIGFYAGDAQATGTIKVQ